MGSLPWCGVTSSRGVGWSSWAGELGGVDMGEKRKEEGRRRAARRAGKGSGGERDEGEEPADEGTRMRGRGHTEGRREQTERRGGCVPRTTNER